MTSLYEKSAHDGAKMGSKASRVCEKEIDPVTRSPRRLSGSSLAARLSGLPCKGSAQAGVEVLSTIASPKPRPLLSKKKKMRIIG